MIEECSTYVNFKTDILNCLDESINIFAFDNREMSTASGIAVFYYFLYRYSFILRLEDEIDISFITILSVNYKHYKNIDFDMQKIMHILLDFSTNTFKSPDLGPQQALYDALIREFNFSKDTINLESLNKWLDMVDIKVCKLCSHYEEHKYAINSLYVTQPAIIESQAVNEILNEFDEKAEVLPILFNIYNYLLKNTFEAENNIVSYNSAILDKALENVVKETDSAIKTLNKYNLNVDRTEILIFHIKLLELTIKGNNKQPTKDEIFSVMEECINSTMVKEFLRRLYSNSNDNIELIVKTVHSCYQNFCQNYAEKYKLTYNEIVVMSVLQDTGEYMNDNQEKYFEEQNILFFLVALGGATVNKDTKKNWDFNQFVDKNLYETDVDNLFRASITSLIISFTIESSSDDIDAIIDKIYERGNEIFDLCKKLINKEISNSFEELFGLKAEQFQEEAILDLKEAADNIITLMQD